MIALPTIWNGRRFRSRLEARWAQWFALWGLAADYEPVGVRLPSGLYLPDWRLPDGSWLELKGARAVEADAYAKASDLARATGEQVIIMHEPWWPVASAVLVARRDGRVQDDAADPPSARALRRWVTLGQPSGPWTTWLLPPGHRRPVLGALVTSEDIAWARHPRLAASYRAAMLARFAHR